MATSDGGSAADEPQTLNPITISNLPSKVNSQMPQQLTVLLSVTRWEEATRTSEVESGRLKRNRDGEGKGYGKIGTRQGWGMRGGARIKGKRA